LTAADVSQPASISRRLKLTAPDFRAPGADAMAGRLLGIVGHQALKGIPGLAEHPWTSRKSVPRAARFSAGRWRRDSRADRGDAGERSAAARASGGTGPLGSISIQDFLCGRREDIYSAHSTCRAAGRTIVVAPAASELWFCAGRNLDWAPHVAAPYKAYSAFTRVTAGCDSK
jgi:hypothetical protein